MINSREQRKAEHVVRMREKRNICRFLIGKRDGKRPLRRTRGRWEDKILEFSVIALESMNWIRLTEDWDRLINLDNELEDSTNCAVFLD